MKRILSAALALSLLGCSATSFDRAALRKTLEGGPEVTDADIKAALDLKPQLHFPFKLAIYLDPDPETTSRWSGRLRQIPWSWTAGDQRDILGVREDLLRSGVASDVVIMSHLTTDRVDLPGIRLAAARYGADAVLVMRGADQVDQYANPASLLYITIVGAWIAPGSQLRSLSVVQGAMWDVRNGYLYSTIETEGEDSTFGPIVNGNPILPGHGN